MAERLGVPVATLDDWRDEPKPSLSATTPMSSSTRRASLIVSRPIEGLDRVVGYFPSQEEAWEWLVTPNLYTGNTAPIDRLRSRHIEEVVRAAEGALDFQ